MPAAVNVSVVRRIAWFVAVIAFALDLLTKYLVSAHLHDRPPLHVVGDFLQFIYVRNPGAAFGTGTSLTPLITVIAIIAAVIVTRLILKVRSRLWAVALGLMLAGIFGNLSDRIFRDPGPFRGHVVDFIAFPHYPVFNIADICINVAAGIMVLQMIRNARLDGTRPRSVDSRV